ncbi:MAG: IS630 family transposase [Verrucomicrobiales bacterium]
MKASRRLRAIHLMLCGADCELTRKHSRVTERYLQLWISRFHEAGIEALTDRPKTGRPRSVSQELVAEGILPLVEDPALAGQSHWTATKLVDWLKSEKDLPIAYSTLVRYLHEHDYQLKVPRPMPEPPNRKDWEDQRARFADELLDLRDDDRCDVYFGDEAGFEGDPRPHRKWARRGERITQGYFGKHVRKNVLGAVHPKSGNLVSLIVPHCDGDVFQGFSTRWQRKRHPLPIDGVCWFSIMPAGARSRLSTGITSNQTLLDKPQVVRSVCRTHSP